MNLIDLRDKMQVADLNIEDMMQIYEELEASYQQMIAMSELLTQAEKKYSILIQNMRDIVWIADIYGQITYINDIATDILGYAPSEMIGRKLYEFMCPLHEYKTGFCKDVVARMNDVEFIRQEMWMLHKDGNTRKVLEVNTKQVFYENDLVEIQGVGRDITERIQIERKITRKNRQMSFINDISTTITSNLSLDNLDQLLNETCKSIVSAINVPLCTIRLIDENAQLVLKAAHGKYKDKVTAQGLDLKNSWLESILLKHQATVLNEASLDDLPQSVKQLFAGSKIKNLLVLPLNANDTSLGLLNIGLDSEYDDEYASLFSSLANNIAFAVEKSNLYKNLKIFYINIIMTLVAAMEAKDTYTQGHSLRVSKYAMKIAETLGMTTSEIEDIEIAGILHDIGKIGISDTILAKPGLLTREEFEIIKLHPSIGMKILGAIDMSSDIKSAILYHHLRVDLSGYPQNSDVRELTLFAKIIGVADALDAMTSNRSYKKAMCCEELIDELRRHSGSQFCPIVTEATIKLIQNRAIIPMNERPSHG